MSDYTETPWVIRQVLHGHFNAMCLGITQKGVNKGDLTECVAIIDPIVLVTDLQKANARRIVACVNACDDWDTVELEQGLLEKEYYRKSLTLTKQSMVIRDMVEVLKDNAETFKLYEEMHRGKGKEDKAEANRIKKDACFKVLKSVERVEQLGGLE